MILEISVPLGTLGLLGGQPLPDHTSVEVERTASISGIASLLVAGDGVADVVAALAANPAVDDVMLVGDTVDGSCYHVRRADDPPALVERVRDDGGTVLSAASDGDAWTLELRFPDQDAASRFYKGYDDHDNPIRIRSSNPAATAHRKAGDVLTPEQGEALRRAFETGYFDVPRRTSTLALADDLNISDTAVSQRLRRGMSNILGDVSTYTSQPVVADRQRVE